MENHGALSKRVRQRECITGFVPWLSDSGRSKEGEKKTRQLCDGHLKF